jgi:hypothetical protein
MLTFELLIKFESSSNPSSGLLLLGNSFRLLEVGVVTGTVGAGAGTFVDTLARGGTGFDLFTILLVSSDDMFLFSWKTHEYYRNGWIKLSTLPSW